MPKHLGVFGELLQRFSQSMSDLHILSAQLSQQLHVVISRNAKRNSLCNHRHHKVQCLDDLGSTIDKIPKKQEFPIWRRHYAAGRGSDLISQLLQQFDQLVITSMHVANDVERPAIILAIIPQRLALDRNCFDFLRSSQHVNVAKTLAR